MPVTLGSPRPAPVISDPPRKRWTREECLALEQTGIVDLQKYELIEGELVEKLSKKVLHGRVLALVVDWLLQIFGRRTVLTKTGIDVSPEDTPTSYPEPDVILLRQSVVELGESVRPDDIRLLVEISDTSLAFDLGQKARLYARAGIVEYWVMDLKSRTVIVHRDPPGGVYNSVVAYADREQVSTLAAPDAMVMAAEFFGSAPNAPASVK